MEYSLFLIIVNIGLRLIALFLSNTMVYSLAESRLKAIKYLSAKTAEPNPLKFSYYVHDR